MSGTTRTMTVTFEGGTPEGRAETVALVQDAFRAMLSLPEDVRLRCMLGFATPADVEAFNAALAAEKAKRRGGKP